MGDSIVFSNTSTHSYVFRNFFDKWFREPFGQQLINNLKLDEATLTSTFMDMIKNVGHGFFVKGRKKMSASFIPNWQLEMSEEIHGERVEITVGLGYTWYFPIIGCS